MDKKDLIKLQEDAFEVLELLEDTASHLCDDRKV